MKRLRFKIGWWLACLAVKISGNQISKPSPITHLIWAALKRDAESLQFTIPPEATLIGEFTIDLSALSEEEPDVS